jgi:hypothetical protein
MQKSLTTTPLPQPLEGEVQSSSEDYLILVVDDVEDLFPLIGVEGAFGDQ